MASIDDVLANIEPREVPARINTRGDLLARIRALTVELAQAEAFDQDHNEPATAPPIRDRLEQLSADYDAGSVEFRFVGLPHDRYMSLLASCPPTDLDRQFGRDYDGERFPAELIAASCVEPDLTVGQVRDLAEKLTHGQWETLWSACYSANLGIEDEAIPFSVAAFGAILDSAPSSTTAATGESPTPSSADG